MAAPSTNRATCPRQTVAESFDQVRAQGIGSLARPTDAGRPGVRRGIDQTEVKDRAVRTTRRVFTFVFLPGDGGDIGDMALCLALRCPQRVPPVGDNGDKSMAPKNLGTDHAASSHSFGPMR